LNHRLHFVQVVSGHCGKQTRTNNKSEIKYEEIRIKKMAHHVDLLVFDLEIQMACEPIVEKGLFNITSGF